METNVLIRQSSVQFSAIWSKKKRLQILEFWKKSFLKLNFGSIWVYNFLVKYKDHKLSHFHSKDSMV